MVQSRHGLANDGVDLPLLLVQLLLSPQQLLLLPQSSLCRQPSLLQSLLSLSKVPVKGREQLIKLHPLLLWRLVVPVVVG